MNDWIQDLTEEQRAELDVLRTAAEKARIRLVEARQKHDRACDALYLFKHEHTTRRK